MSEPPPIELRGAGEHNLAGFDLDLPWGRWIAVTGPSGSGKTSLVFDILVREGQRRYLGGLSARARQLFGKLGRAQVRGLQGLPVPLAIGHAGAGSARSTVGTRSGLLDLLRLVFARAGRDPGGEALTRSHFSFNVAPGACEACAGLGTQDRVVPALLVADASKSIRDGALVPTLPNGYTVYSQVTLEVLDTVCRAHGFDVDTPWQDLTDAQRHVIYYGSKALRVPFGKHSIESRMKWEGITARPREEGFYRGLIPVIEETLQRNRNANILRFVESAPCSACHGTRLSRAGREATVGERTLPDLLAMPADALASILLDFPGGPAWDAVRPSVRDRLARMQALSLGHLSLARTTDSLSGGEAQRLQLATLLGTGLGGMLVALDEPTLGLHPEARPGMRDTLDAVLAMGNTLVVVEHDPAMVRHADRVIALGPGAGSEGGRLVDVDDPRAPLGPPPTPRARTRAARGTLTLRGASLHNLQDADLHVELGCFNVVLGPSGAGKSSLVFGTLLPAVTGTRGGPFRRLEGLEHTAVAAVDARPIGRTPRSTPATWTGLFDRVRRAFAATPEAKAAKLGATAFSYNNKAGRCPQCEGLGVERLGLHLLEDVERPCGACGGGRYAPTVLDVQLRGKSIADVLSMTVHEAVEYFEPDPLAHALCAAMQTLGLGYLPLGHGSHQLSRGEAQRVKLATLLGRADAQPSLLLLDEPDRGLHPLDIERLLGAIDAIVDAGHTVLAISHHRHVWAAADVRTEVREGVATHDVPFVAEDDGAPTAHRRPVSPPQAIRLRGVTTHTLANIDVDLPHRQLIAVAGVSGSGKSSLVFDTLVAEAWHRFSESLPFSVRRHVRRQARPELARAEGLTPVLALRPGGARASRRSTVATQAEVGPLLRLLWSRGGEPSGFSAEHFSTDRPLGACPACAGLGLIPRCDPSALVTEPSAPLSGGAMAGTKPGTFFSAADDQHVATLRAALRARGLSDDLEGPWSSLAAPVREIALHGAGEQTFSVQWSYKRGKRAGTHTFEGPWLGLCRLVEREAKRRAKRKDAQAWAAPLIDAPCSGCGGTGLRPEVARVSLGGLELPDVLALRADAVLPTLDAAELSGRARAAYDALRPELATRLEAVAALGLGHLALSRRSPTLSGGELQRLRLGTVLHAGLAHTTVVLDEPTAGLHDDDVRSLLARLRGLRDAGNTVLVVSHRPSVLRAADHIVELGPGAGPDGGTIVAQGSAADVLAGDSPTATALRARARPRPERALEIGVRIRGASAHGLPERDLDLPASGVVALTGRSGTGKSTLLFEVLEASARAGAPRGCREATGLERFCDVRSSRDPLGATPLTTLGVMPPLQTLFAKASGGALPKAAFSFDSPKGRCETCKGRGVERVAMDALADLQLPCPACDGARYRAEVLAVRWKGQSIADVLSCPASLLVDRFSGALQVATRALVDVGLGHVSLGRRRSTLSGGEAQRLMLAARTLERSSPSLVLLDEPGTGLHELDLDRVRAALHRLAERGDLIVIAEHRRSLIDACDLEIPIQ
ncbi:MAG: AAA family ATPase [Nannocystaceae bacterium]|nr:AAA family ATPase [bacterium]